MSEPRGVKVSFTLTRREAEHVSMYGFRRWSTGVRRPLVEEAVEFKARSAIAAALLSPGDGDATGVKGERV